MTDELIPFGKYKGQPIETLAQDKSYADWVVSQSNIKRKYPDIYLYILNNFRRPDDTPEHNKLQVKFLDKGFSLKLAYLLEPSLFNEAELPKIFNPTFEAGYDVSYTVITPSRNKFIKILIEIKPTIGDDFPSVLRQMKASMPIKHADDLRDSTFYCLIVRYYVGEGATQEQFIQFFYSQGYQVVFWSDIENVNLPEIE